MKEKTENSSGWNVNKYDEPAHTHTFTRTYTHLHTLTHNVHESLQPSQGKHTK